MDSKERWQKIQKLSPAKRELLLQYLQQERKAQQAITIHPRSEPRQQFPLSFAQQRLWFIHQIMPASPAYNDHVAIEIKGTLDVAVLEKACASLMQRHEILCTQFSMVSGELVQTVHPQLPVPFTVIDHQWASFSPAERAQTLTEAARFTFDLTQAPLFRCLCWLLPSQTYLLSLTMHHIISDGWSLSLFVQELATIYQALVHQRALPLSPLSVQYGDYAVWQQQQLQEAALQEHSHYWQQQLKGMPTTLSLPNQQKRPPVQTFQGTRYAFTLSPHLIDALETVSKTENVTLFMTLLAAFQLLLHRYTGQVDICIGTPMSLRDQVALEGLLGPLTNMVVIRNHFGGNPTFQMLLAQVKRNVLAAQTHRYLPYEKLVDLLQPVRSATIPPLVQVVFALENAYPTHFTHPDFQMQLLFSNNETAKFDLTFYITEGEDKYNGFVEYNRDLFDQQTIIDLVTHWQHVLEQISQTPQQHIKHISLLTEVERQKLLDQQFRQVEGSEGRKASIPHLFRQQVDQVPHHLAVSSPVGQLTYQQLNQQADQLAGYLLQQGLAPESIVAVLLPPSLEVIVAALAIMKAGGAYLMLDVQLPSARVEYILQDAQAAFLITRRSLHALVSNKATQLICLDAVWDAIMDAHYHTPTLDYEPQQLAYVIYTSGSTGKPKGVQLTHAGLSNLVAWHQHAFTVTNKDRATQIAGLSFDAAVWEIWPYLTMGASLYIPDQETRLLPTKVLDWLLANAITITFLPTPLAEQVMRLSWSDDATLRLLLTGGDKLHDYPPADMPFTLVNNYGPTEATVVATSTTILPRSASESRLPAIGQGIHNTQLYILDTCGQLAPAGMPGELHIGGISLARGYVQQPRQTAEKFVPDPFSPTPGARMYRTGDLVRHRPDGQIDFLGRIDDQVKIMGFRIEVGEIEQALNDHPQIQKAIVLARPDSKGHNRLAAYIMAPQALSSTELRHFLQSQLPAYMLPHHFLFFDTFPLNTSGKIDRQQLLNHEIEVVPTSTKYIEPQTILEQQIADVWCDVLQLDTVSIQSNFFEIGGQSFLLAQVHQQLQDVVKQEVSMIELFQYPTIQALAQKLSQHQKKPTASKGLNRAQKRQVRLQERQTRQP